MKTLLKKIWWVLSKRQRIGIFGVAIMMFIAALFELLGISLLLPFVSAVMYPEKVQEIEIINQIASSFNINRRVDMIVFLAVGMLVLYVVKNIYISLAYRIKYNFIFFNQKEVASCMLEKYLGREYLFFTKHDSAELIRNINLCVEMFFTTTLAFIDIFSEACVCFIILCYLLIQDVEITLIVGLTMGVVMGLYSICSKRVLVKLGYQMKEGTKGTLKWLQQSFGGAKELLLFGKRDFFIANYKKEYLKWAKSRSKSLWLSILSKPIMETMCLLSVMVMIVVKILLQVPTSEFIPMLSVFAVAVIRLLPSYNAITQNISFILYNNSGIDTVYKSMAMEEIESEKTEQETCVERIEYKREVMISDVTFQYETDKECVLYHVNLTIPCKKSIAIVGASGSGKTTLIDILLGLIKPNSGTVMVDGKDIEENMSGWQALIGYIPQNVYLLDDSIRNNIAFGIASDEIDNEKIAEVIRETQLEEYILSLPRGLETIVGERGVALSGGQKQRIGIARALYRNPEILVMDEATSALDMETESAVMQAINCFAGKKTMVIIAHRLSTIEECEIKYEVKDGSVKRI